MHLNPFDEFPHVVSTLIKTSTPNGSGGSVTSWVPSETFNAFVDTPTSKERIYAMQMNVTLDRYMYYPYGRTIAKTARIKFEGASYEVAGECEDQGGMHEIMCIPLKLVI